MWWVPEILQDGDHALKRPFSFTVSLPLVARLFEKASNPVLRLRPAQANIPSFSLVPCPLLSILYLHSCIPLGFTTLSKSLSSKIALKGKAPTSKSRPAGAPLAPIDYFLDQARKRRHHSGTKKHAVECLCRPHPRARYDDSCIICLTTYQSRLCSISTMRKEVRPWQRQSRRLSYGPLSSKGRP